MKQVQATSARSAVSLMVSLCGLLYLQVSLELLLVVRGFNGLKDLLAQLMLLQQLAEAQVRFFLLMIKKSFLAIFMRVKYAILKRFR